MDRELTDATKRLDELMSAALTSRPQRITRRNQAVIVLSEAEYEQLVGSRATLTEYLLSGPGLRELDLRRDQTMGREIPV